MEIHDHSNGKLTTKKRKATERYINHASTSIDDHYYIQAIKEGLVVKTVNVDTQGKPTQKVKTIKNIMSSKKVGRRSMKREPSAICEFKKLSGDELDEDNIEFNSLTLKEMKDICKEKNKKLVSSKDLTAEKNVMADAKEYESDTEVLSSFILRVSKKPKVKCGKILDNTLSTLAPCSIKCSVQNAMDFHVSGSETLEPDFSSHENRVCAVDKLVTDYNEEHLDEMPDYSSNIVPIMGISYFFEKSSRVDDNEVSLDLSEQVEHSISASTTVVADVVTKLFPTSTAVIEDTIEIGFPSVTSHDCFGLSVTQQMEDQDSTHQLPCISLIESDVVTNYQISEEKKAYMDIVSNTISGQEESNCGNRSDDIIEGNLRNMERNHYGLLELNQQSNEIILAADGHCEFGEETSNSDPNVNAKSDYETPSFDTTRGIEDMEALNDHSVLKLELPRSMLTKRKVISPTSQEKLLQTLKSIELNGNVRSSKELRQKFRIKNQFKNKGPKHNIDLRKAKVSGTSNNVMRSTPPSVCNGILKLQKGTPMQTYAQKAVTFCQLQMQDTESLAIKILNELESMTELVNIYLDSSLDLPSSLNHTYDKMRTSIESVKRTEETTKKCISMMDKDCKRFCKIMRSVQKDANDANATRSDDVHKAKRKIKFADEIGERLCHVKIIENRATFPRNGNCDSLKLP